MVSAMHLLSSVALAFAVGSASPAEAADCPNVVGSYGAVSESEWDIQVALMGKGRAEVIHTAWLAREYEKRKTTRTPATWRFVEGCIIEVSYLGTVDRFEYMMDLPLAELGYAGGAPGLRQLQPFASASKISGVSLWKLPHKFGDSR